MTQDTENKIDKLTNDFISKCESELRSIPIGEFADAMEYAAEMISERAAMAADEGDEEDGL